MTALALLLKASARSSSGDHSFMAFLKSGFSCSDLAARSTLSAIRSGTGAPQEGRKQRPGSRLPGWVRACGSRAQVQSGKAQMWHGTGHRKAAGDHCPCNCYVRSGSESPQDPVRLFHAIHISDGHSLATGKMGHCSVNINSIFRVCFTVSTGWNYQMDSEMTTAFSAKQFALFRYHHFRS